jgi:hypothetical protein
MAVRPFVAAAAVALAMTLGACQDSAMLGGASTRSLTPIPPQTLALMQTKGMSQSDPILIRAFKKEAEMEVWKRGANGQYALLKTFPICRWSGQLGPKLKQGDRQAPEGFYTITPGSDEPEFPATTCPSTSGYPNAVDRAKGGTGQLHHGARHLLVVGLLCHDRCLDGRDLRHRPRGLQRRSARLPVPVLPVPDDGVEHRQVPQRPERDVLEEPQGGLGLFRDPQGRAAGRGPAAPDTCSAAPTWRRATAPRASIRWWPRSATATATTWPS